MTLKDYFRNLYLQDLGYPADPKVIELRDYITERLSNLNQYISKEYTDYICYGKSKDELIINYNSKNMYINLYYDNFSHKLFVHFGLKYTDIEAIIISYVVDTLQIKVNIIQTHYFIELGIVIDALQIKVNNINGAGTADVASCKHLTN